ncbi:hypothetical protein NE237_031746 [Protea cynaroides]|uniref:Uncharacterized protein n=1 Tax=Protea cynaroides TaxID=273540 RepID=A0A9Q0R2R3_9MAGN|nr:hypothetical protein NE237_031746 [Protea cynaroides]
MVSAGLRVAPRMRNQENGGSQVNGMAHENLPLSGIAPLSHVNASGVGGNVNDGRSLDLVRAQVDLGKFLGFRSLEAEGVRNGNKSGQYFNLPYATRNVKDLNRRTRKRRKWSPREKGKNVASNDVPSGTARQRGDDASVQGHGGSGVEDRNPGNMMGGRSFAAVLSGLPDLGSLLKPVVEGGITRVVIPQSVYERQLEKYKLALIGMDDLGRWADIDDKDVPLDIEEGELTEGAQSLLRMELMIRLG